MFEFLGPFYGPENSLKKPDTISYVYCNNVERRWMNILDKTDVFEHLLGSGEISNCQDCAFQNDA